MLKWRVCVADGWRQFNHRCLPARHHWRVHGTQSLCSPASRWWGASEVQGMSTIVRLYLSWFYVFIFTQTTQRRVWMTMMMVASKRTSGSRTSTFLLPMWLVSWRMLFLRLARWDRWNPFIHRGKPLLTLDIIYMPHVRPCTLWCFIEDLHYFQQNIVKPLHNRNHFY